MNTQNSRSKELLGKVYDHLDTIDVTNLSMGELKDFLEVVQKGQFLESYGQMPLYGYGLANPILTCLTQTQAHQTRRNDSATDLWVYWMVLLITVFPFSNREPNRDLARARKSLAEVEKLLKTKT